jgi:hypothetical protein
MNYLHEIRLFLVKLGKSLTTIINVTFLSKNSKIDHYNTESELVIIGNGPSLSNTIESNPSFFDDNSLIAVNHFAITEYYEQLKPEYYIAIAHDLYYDDVEPQFIEASNRLFETIAEKTTWEITLFMPIESQKYKRWQKNLIENEKIKIRYINLTPAEGFECITHYFFKKNLAMPRPHNVMIPALITGINMGFSTIFLVGADHSWLKDISVNDNNEALINNRHFYDTNSKPKSFDKKGKGARNLPEILFTLMTAFNSYHIINKYAKKRGVKVLNCTQGSYIDAFERKQLK